MALIRNGELADDQFTWVDDDAALPESGAIVVSLTRWQQQSDELKSRESDVGVRLRSDESPELIAADLERIALVELEFPQFRDGRAYSYARLLRDRFGFEGEIRAVGEVLLEQLHFMVRTGFDAFEIAGDDPLAQYETAMADFSVWYQPTGDGRKTAVQQRHGRG